MQGERTSVWIDGIQRHVEDRKEDAYEGAWGAARHARYVVAFEPLTPVAVDVLQQISASLLHGTGDVSVRAVGPDGHGGQIGSWLLTWPELSESSSRFTGKRLQPVTISAVFPAGFTHPHRVQGGPVDPRAASIAAWPMQGTSREDAEQQPPSFS